MQVTLPYQASFGLRRIKFEVGILREHWGAYVLALYQRCLGAVGGNGGIT